ncbi:MAG: hypothetical protein PHD13_05310 [Methanocellales archaeon]|nr:hypothetical protein [Methanocellales archaeon]MDD3292048.1 hypothetical protein [Methanocellales archaeon]MDD5235571.1 hypothetical protein [Methanocellales archaeon]MDD5485595.1 hypothetical protein [Methanocellales archaeon]
MNVLLSIKPKYANAILSGEKEYEFRKVIFKDRNVERVYIYSSSPVKRIVGVFIVGDIIEGHPERIWERCQKKSGINKEDFFNYFNGSEKGYAIKIDDLETIEDPIDPRSLSSDFVPPQSFCYFDTLSIGGQ